MSDALPEGVEVAILADDLTGAADCAAAFAATGRRSCVLVEPDSNALAGGADCDVVALSTNSRDSEDGDEKLTAAVAELRALGPRVWFKKIDSTLRGRVGPELLAVTRMLCPAVTIVCPAFPEMGRVMRDGHVYVHGKPLERTRLWLDAGGGDADLIGVLSVAGVRAASVDVEELVSGELLARLRTSGEGQVLLVDAETDADLAALIAAVTQSGRNALWVGSAGLAAELAAALAPVERNRSTVGADRGCDTVLIVAGSAAGQTREQLLNFERRLGGSVALLPVRGLLERDAAVSVTAEAVIEEALARGADVALAIEPPGSDGCPTTDASDLVAGLGELAARFASRFDGLVLTGGDTARSVLERLGVGALDLTGSVELGVPVARARQSNLRVVTKAGAFGDDKSLSRAVQHLHGAMVGP